MINVRPAENIGLQQNASRMQKAYFGLPFGEQESELIMPKKQAGFLGGRINFGAQKK